MGIVPTIGRRSRWAPPAGAALDWGHPLAAGLVGFWTGDGTDLTGKLPLVPSDVTRGVGEFGDGAAMVTPSANLDGTATPAHMIGPPATALAVICKLGGPSLNLPVFGILASAAAAKYGVMITALTPNGVAASSSDAGTNVGTSYSGIANGTHVLVATFTATGVEMWIDGQRAVTATVAVNPTYDGTSKVVAGAESVGFAGRTPNFIFHAGSMYNRVLSGNEIAALYADPYCMLRG